LRNDGQSDARVAYYAPTFAGTVFVTHEGEIVYSIGEARKKTHSAEADKAPRRAVLTEKLLNATPIPHGGTPSVTNVSIFHGSDPRQWRSHVKTYETLNLGEAWPGVTVTLHARARSVEKWFTVAPHASPTTIQLTLKGADRLSLAEDGRLIAQTPEGEIAFSAPIAFQDIDGTHTPVAVAYTLADNGYSFTVGEYDASRPLIIDPVAQSTFAGGSNDERALDVFIYAILSKVFVVGTTDSSDYPGIGGGADTTLVSDEAVVARLSLDLRTIEQATFFGGDGVDEATSATINPATGDVIVAGITTSSNLPGISGGADTTRVGQEGFVASLNSTLTVLNQATYVGGDGEDLAYGVVINAGRGDALILVGETTSATNFPGNPTSTVNGGSDIFVTRLNSALTNIPQTILAGGNGADSAQEVAITQTTGDVYVAGYTQSTSGFPGISGGADTTQANGEGFVIRFNNTLTSLIQATYIGGSGFDLVQTLAINQATEGVYVGGWTTTATNFPGNPTTTGADKTQVGQEGFVARFNSALTSIPQATFLGGNGNDAVNGLAINQTNGEVYAGGVTDTATNFPGNPTITGADKTQVGQEGFVARFNSLLTSIPQATFLGGDGNDAVNGLAINQANGEVYAGGVTNNATNFPGNPTITGADKTVAGPSEGFVARLTGDLSDVFRTLAINDVTRAEGNSGVASFLFAVSLSTASTSPVMVNYATVNGTAAAGSDYTATSGTLTFNPGETRKAVTVFVTGDLTVEPNETFVVNLNGASGASIADGQGRGTILNDDGPTLRINDVTATEGNVGNKNFVFTVTLSQAATSNVTVNCVTANGTALAGSDYTAGTTALTFTPGQTSKTCTVPVIGNTVVEPNETFFVNLTTAVGATIFDGQGLSTILNDDGPLLSINNVLLTEGNVGNKNFVFTVTLSPAASSNVTVNCVTANGTALAGSDYTAVNIPLTFTPGQTSKTCTVPVIGSTVVEPNETFFVNLTSPVGATIVDPDLRGTGVILNDDGPLLSINNVTLTEGNVGNKNFVFTVTLSPAAATNVTVNCVTANGTALAGSDYTAGTTALTFTPGQTNKTCTVPVIGNTVVEPNETFFVNLTSPVGATIVDPDLRGIGTITNDD
jgi:hypothetical protein